MASDLFCYQLGLIALLWLCLMLHWVWHSAAADAYPTIPAPHPRSLSVRSNPLRVWCPRMVSTDLDDLTCKMGL